MLQEAQRAKIDIRRRILSYIAAGFGFVTGLAWNDAIKLLIDYFVPQTGNTVIAKFIYAVVLTVIVGFILFYIERVLGASESDGTK